MKDRELQAATRSFLALSTFTNPCAATLTLKQVSDGTRIDSITAPISFRHFRNRLNGAIFGNAARRYGKFVPIIAVLELSASNRYHYHCAIDRPSHIEEALFEQHIRTQWQKTPFGYHQIDFQRTADAGWLSYITKRSQKERYPDSIDWLNTVIQTAE